MDGNGEVKFLRKFKKKNFFLGGGQDRSGGGGGGGGCRVGGVQGGCKRRSLVFVKIQKKIFFFGGVGVGGQGHGGLIRGWGGGGSKAWGRG